MRSEAADGESRRLHPLSPVFAIASAAWKLLLPGLVVLFVASRGGRYELWAMVLFLPAVIGAVAKYVSFRYRLGEDELVIRQGILTRNERNIPYARIQNIDLVQNPFHRALGVASIKLETAGGEEPEASIQVLSLAAVEEMRARVFRGRPDEIDTDAGVAAAGRAKTGPLLRLSLRDLVLYGLISNRGMAIVLAVAGLAWQASWQGWLPDRVRERLDPRRIDSDAIRDQIVGSAPDWASPFVTAFLVLAVLLLALLAMRLLSVVWAIIKLHGFNLTRRGDDLRTSFGLFTKLSATIPRHRIQLMTLRETILHRAFRRVEIKVETAGGQEDDSEVSRQLLVPLVESRHVATLLAAIQPGLDPDELEWRRVDPRAWGRVLRKLILLLLFAAALATTVFGVWALVALPVVGPLAVLIARLRHDRLGYALTPNAVVYRSGWWVRRLSVVRFTKIQVVGTSQNPFDRRYGMASVQVDTAGAGRTGHRVRIPFLQAEVAGGIHERLGLEAASTEFSW